MKKVFTFKSIRTKLIFGFSLLIILVLTMSVLNYLGFQTINRQTEDVMKKQLPLLITNENLVLNIAEITSSVRGYILYEDSNIKEQLNKLLQDGENIEKQLLTLSDNEEIKMLLNEKSKWEALIDDAIRESSSGNKDQAMEILNGAKPISVDITNKAKKLMESRKDLIANSGEEVIFTGKATNIFIMIIAIIILITGIVTALLISRSITNPILSVMKRMNELANGILNQEPLQTNARDEIGELVSATNMMSSNNRKLLNKIFEVSETVSSQSEELTQIASEVKSGTEQAAITMEELASGAETQANSTSDLANIIGTFTKKVEVANENGSLIQDNSNKVLEMTIEGRKLMNSSTNQMTKVNHIVNNSVEKMQNLDNQLQEISKIVSVIKTIADQTNLLALNAMIESARAGEHGKGFAVVADEVRKLAEQVALSVNDITVIVTNIQTESSVVTDSLKVGFTEVQQGTAQIETTEKTFNEISSSVTEMGENIKVVSKNLMEILLNNQKTSEAIEEIASVSEEAAAGIEQTAASAQQVSSSMEGITGSSEQLVKLAEELNELVRQFKF
ncbi:HAMP domain-containing methyl-accepting chemotaxis protein [Metabacillus fastidiosus]|uniref:methyl-accepting chemotaxis protein n=1 Tax=Metabacillus fastidiosus TaxID=1458 RepID=UPI003D2E0E04